MLRYATVRRGRTMPGRTTSTCTCERAPEVRLRHGAGVYAARSKFDDNPCKWLLTVEGRTTHTATHTAC